MKKELTTWMHEDNIYIVSGGASANSLFFEDKKCHEMFFRYFQRFLDDMVDVLHYKLTKSGWAILIRTKSEDKIKKAYRRQRKLSYKADPLKEIFDTKRMLSEHFRFFLSSFVRTTNDYLGREGVLVKMKFSKIAINTLKDYKVQFERICQIQECIYQQKLKKYQPDKRNYDREGDMSDLSIWKSSINFYEKNLRLIEMPITVKLVRPYSDVLRQILAINKNDQKPYIEHPKME